MNHQRLYGNFITYYPAYSIWLDTPWLRLLKPIIYDQIDSSFISCFYGAILEIDVNYDLTSDFFYMYKRTIVDM